MDASLKGKRVLITGCGIKPVHYVFKDITTKEHTHTPVKKDEAEYKANIGAATAFECAKAGAIVHIVSHSETKLKIIKEWIEVNIPDSKVEYSALDLNNKNEVNNLIKNLPNDLPLFWVQSVGLGAGTVQIKDDNPYLSINDLSMELVEAELTVLKNTISLLQLLLPSFRKQKETRICIISSMSAIRGYPNGAVHAAAKGSISRFANAATIELDHDNIFITDVRPGIVDTGMYDSEVVRKVVIKVGKSFGFDYSKAIFAMPPSAVGEAIITALTSKAHITSINMVARGQWPHEGS